MKKRLILVLIMVFIVTFMTGCGTNAKLRSRIKRMNKEISKLKEENKELRDNEKSELCEQLEEAYENDSLTSFINIKFPIDGNTYGVKDSEVHFYEDKECLFLAEDLPIISPVVDTLEIKEGSTVYCVRAMEDGETVFLFSFRYPELYVTE